MSPFDPDCKFFRRRHEWMSSRFPPGRVAARVPQGVIVYGGKHVMSEPTDAGHLSTVRTPGAGRKRQRDQLVSEHGARSSAVQRWSNTADDVAVESRADVEHIR